MEIDVQKNKQGQTLGRKGQETRARLMDAARNLLLTHSPVELTAVAIAAEAGTSPASFYMYFDDTKDILFALSEVAGQDMATIHMIFEQPWTEENLEQRAGEVIDALNGVWDRHRPVLRYRNLEATRGDKRFAELRLNTFIPFIEKFAECILMINPPTGTRRRADAYAEASILQGAMEHMAATEPEVMAGGLGRKRINTNLAKIVALVMRGSTVPTLLEAPIASTTTVENAPAASEPKTRKKAGVKTAAKPEETPSGKLASSKAARSTKTAKAV